MHRRLFGPNTLLPRPVFRTVCLLVALFIAYLLAAFVPYTVTVRAAPPEYASFLGDGSDERALLMPTSEETFFTRLVLAERARRKIDVATYNFSDDAGARYFVAALIKAADRGVTVRVFTDGKMSGLGLGRRRELRDMMARHENIELYFYNNLNLLDPGMLAVSMHDKIFNVDDEHLIVGGANIGFRHFVSNDDLEVLVSSGDKPSPAVADVNAYYERLLSSRHTERYRKKPPVSSGVRCALGYEYEAYYAAAPFDKTRDYYAESLPVDKITVAVNPIEGKKRAPVVLETLFTLAEQSDRVHLRTPYFALTDEYIDRFKAASAHAQEFIIATNSLYNTPNMAFGVYLKNRKRVLTPTLTLYEYQNPKQVHGKAAVFDDRLSAVGSFNMDERSAHIDTEIMLIIDSRPFNAALRTQLNTYVAQSRAVGSDNTYLPSDVPAPAVSFGKKALYALYGWLFNPFIQLI